MTVNGNVYFRSVRAAALATVAAIALAACNGQGGFGLGGGGGQRDSAQPASQSVELIERDVEAPDVFQVSDNGLWDGRPSLGGVWVAHPDVSQPERVIIRNPSNGKFVIGALFRRERENPGPLLQVSSDAAAALGMLAGAPSQLSVTALRREEVPQATPEATTDFGEPSEIAATPLDPIAGAAAAIDAAEAQQTGATPPPPAAAPAPVEAPAEAPAAAPAPETPPAPVAAPATGSPERPFVQLGIFAIQANADATAEKLRKAGVSVTVKEESSQGRTFWRVIAGPAATEAERADLLAKVKGMGFTDAYFVKN